MERRMRGNSHVRCEVGENPEETAMRLRRTTATKGLPITIILQEVHQEKLM